MAKSEPRDDRLNIRVPAWIRAKAETTARLLGVSVADVVVLCLEQQLAPPDAAGRLRASLSGGSPRQAATAARPSRKVSLPRRRQETQPGAANQADTEG